MNILIFNHPSVLNHLLIVFVVINHVICFVIFSSCLCFHSCFGWLWFKCEYCVKSSHIHHLYLQGYYIDIHRNKGLSSPIYELWKTSNIYCQNIIQNTTWCLERNTTFWHKKLQNEQKTIRNGTHAIQNDIKNISYLHRCYLSRYGCT